MAMAGGKRKRARPQEAHASTLASSDAAPKEEEKPLLRFAGPTECKVQLPPGTKVAISGVCDLTVREGSVRVLGYTAVCGGTITLTSDEKDGHCLEIEGVGPEAAKLSLHGRCKDGIGAFRAWAAAERQTRGAVIPRDWIDLAGRILAQWGETGAAPRIAVVGAKGAGKSTLARFLTNALLSHSHQVAYVDTDLGQAELSMAGFVAGSALSAPIFGPPWLQQAVRPDVRPQVQVFLGDASPQGDPAGYLDAVAQVTAGMAADVSTPVVLNTHGWVRGTGLELVVEALEVLAPTHVIVLQIPGGSRNVAPEDVASAVDGQGMPPEVVLLPSAVAAASTGVRAERAKDKGTAAFLCRATGLDMPGVAEADLWRVVSEAVESTAPFEVAQDALWVHVRGASGPTTPAVLPGQIVAMVAEGGACVGSAFVRGFDPDAGTIHVLTDVDEVMLEHVEGLVVGSQGVVHQVLRSERGASGFLAQHCIATKGTGARQQRSRSGLQRVRLGR